jgi:hypothetical protein
MKTRSRLRQGAQRGAHIHPVNAEERRRLLSIFAGGSAEELSAVLQLLHLISTHPKTKKAGRDFPHQAGSALKNERKMSTPN